MPHREPGQLSITEEETFEHLEVRSFIFNASILCNVTGEVGAIPFTKNKIKIEWSGSGRGG